MHYKAFRIAIQFEAFELAEHSKILPLMNNESKEKPKKLIPLSQI